MEVEQPSDQEQLRSLVDAGEGLDAEQARVLLDALVDVEHERDAYRHVLEGVSHQHPYYGVLTVLSHYRPRSAGQPELPPSSRP